MRLGARAAERWLSVANRTKSKLVSYKDSMKKLIVCTLAFLVAGVVAVRAADAKENWEKNCANCHGADGKGDTTMGKRLGIKDYTDPKVQESLKPDEMTKAIKDGKPPKMKGFGDTLSDDEIKALVAYVKAFKK